MPRRLFTSGAGEHAARTPSVDSEATLTPGTPLTLTTSGDDGGRNISTDLKGPLGLNLLHEPVKTLVELIFVHGLGGGSRKTWSKSTSVKDFWPQEWLPPDPAFQNVRIYSFGYDSDWIKGRKNVLNMHHFGKSLLGQISTLPCLRDADTPIVFIGHSMGGLVIKKAYNLARQGVAYEFLTNRIRTVIFLATPHRGSDSAKLLGNLLWFASSSKEYVNELKEDSGTIQTISDEFRNYEQDLDLWSFYETEPLRIGKVVSQLIVEPQSAVIGCHNEKQMPMAANHRSICKFNSPADITYQVLRNGLDTAISSLLKNARTSGQDLLKIQLNELKSYLGVSDDFDVDLVAAQEARLSGTCEWFSKKHIFKSWKDFSNPAPTILWIGAKPAAGKSILAGYAIDELQMENGRCGFFFFKYGDRSKSQLSACLRSLAFQMACSDPKIRQKLLEMHREQITFDQENERMIWRKLFVSGVFKSQISTHYWVIDALDECSNSSILFDLMLGEFESQSPLRILIISRLTGELEDSFKNLESHRYSLQQISTADTLPDIKLLVESKAKAFRFQNDEDRTALVEKILLKSNGSFLWTVLVINELSRCYSKEDINQVFDEVPPDMRPWYQRTLDIMSQNPHGSRLTKTILIWATCATRPMTLAELRVALQLVSIETSHGLEQTIIALCGQLVTVDRLGRVQMVHETAREFLLDTTIKSDLASQPLDAHTTIAKTCLRYLTGDEMKPPRMGRSQPSIVTKKGELCHYACTTFSYHLAHSDPRSNDLLILLGRFLRLNVLSWIEIIAQTKDLLLFIRIAKHLRSYLKVCSVERSPLSREISLLKGWTTDLLRITAKFADALVLSPSAIYSLILPFCPTSSSVYKTSNNGRRLTIKGLSNTQWDDRISCIDFNHGQTSAVSAGDQFLGVGLTNGAIVIYHALSYQEFRRLEHGEAVKFLQFKEKSDLMASCGIKSVRLWDARRGTVIHHFQAPQRPISLAFNAHLLMAASHQNTLMTWDLENEGARKPDLLWTDPESQIGSRLRRPPSAISISVSHQMLAIAYSGKAILLWELAGDSFYGTCGRKLSNGETSTHVVSSLVFNPNPNVGLLAASYLDGQLSILDPFSDQEQCNFRADCHTLAASQDGRFLVGAAGFGTIQVYEFDTLRLLYSVKSSNFYIKQLAFSPDGLHFVDIRGSQCNVWEPAILLRDIVCDESSEDSSTSVVEVVSSDSKVKISAISLPPESEVAFCGKEDGSVVVHSVKSGVQMGTLYRHKSLVRIVTWWPLTGIIMSVDTSNTIFAWKLQQGTPSSWKTDAQLFQSRLDCGSTIMQVLPGDEHGKLVLSTRESDHFWTVDGQQEQVVRHFEKPRIRYWIQHPTSSLHYICIDGASARTYSWNDWSEVSSIHLDMDVDELQLKSASIFMLEHKPKLLLEMSALNGSAITQELYTIDVAIFDVDVNSDNQYDQLDHSTDDRKVEPSPRPALASAILSPRSRAQIDFLAAYVSHVIGISDSGRLVFLDKRSWVCSANLESTFGSSVSYSRHFFIPYDWFSGIRDILCGLVRRDVIFARNDDVVVIKGGLEFVEKVDVKHELLMPKGYDYLR